jgi:hypothetical protein
MRCKILGHIKTHVLGHRAHLKRERERLVATLFTVKAYHIKNKPETGFCLKLSGFEFAVEKRGNHELLVPQIGARYRARQVHIVYSKE